MVVAVTRNLIAGVQYVGEAGPESGLLAPDSHGKKGYEYRKEQRAPDH